MIINREELFQSLEVFQKLKNQKFDIHTQYKILKILRAAAEEESLFQEQIVLACKEYAETNENGEIIYLDDGGMKIKSDQIQKCKEEISKLKKMPVQIPDVYFSIEELTPLNLSMEDLQAFFLFIK